MATDVVVPEVGEMGMDVVFVRWRKAPGESVEVGDILFELDTEKTVVEVEAWTAGTIVDLAVTDGDIVTPRQVVARILAPGEPAPAAEPSSAGATRTVPEGTAGSSPAVSGTDASPSVPELPASGAAGGTSLSPRARALARELGIDPSRIRGTGPGGMVTEQDVRMAAATGGEPG